MYDIQNLINKTQQQKSPENLFSKKSYVIYPINEELNKKKMLQLLRFDFFFFRSFIIFVSFFDSKRCWLFFFFFSFDSLSADSSFAWIFSEYIQ
jgi:hypothetical protein